MNRQPYDVARRLTGIKERPGAAAHPYVAWALSLTGAGESDETAWCSALVYSVAFLLGLSRPTKRRAAARSWLTVGTRVPLAEAELGDVVVLKRGAGDQPGTEVLEAQGHVGFFAGWDVARAAVKVLGGNQSDSVCVQSFPLARVLAVQRLSEQ